MIGRKSSQNQIISLKQQLEAARFSLDVPGILAQYEELMAAT
jgi:hypothetical protein